jgi:PAT family beta-lactamase induction signal transducer AmpG
MSSQSNPASAKKLGMRHVMASLRQPKVLVMLLLGFSSGLPFLLTGNTLGFWLRDEGTSLKAIGFLSWVGIAYSLKFLWAPFIDRLDAPLLGRLGRRRGWMVLSQVLIGLALLAMAMIGPVGGLTLLGIFALIAAFASATQDIVIDAWRIEAADDVEEMALLSSALQLGYRAALLATDALILVSAQHLGWPLSYGLAAAAMTIGLVASLASSEPRRDAGTVARDAASAPLWTLSGIQEAIIGPFSAFFRTHGVAAFLMLAMISLYRLPDFIMGPMANPFYHDLGIGKDMVGAVRGSVGLAASILGIAAGGLFALRFGQVKTLIAGALLQPIAVASFALLALKGGHLPLFSAVMGLDSFAMSFAGVALVAYMSSITSLGYTATQYALLTSTYAWIGKFLKGFSGAAVEGLEQGHGLMGAYAIFFVAAGAIGIPALVLCLVLVRRPQN